MKIELVNDNQIRCILTKEDLADRQLKLSELAYGSEKAKELFRDMMLQANFEFGFEANDIPLMIEAIPVSSESIILVVTKVEDPEELDTRFANFAPGIQGGGVQTEDSSENTKSLTEGAADVLDILKKLREKAIDAVKASKEAAKEAKDKAGMIQDGDSSDSEEDGASDKKDAEAENYVRIFSFDHLDDVIRFAHILKGAYDGVNSLYKMDIEKRYYLEISNSEQSPEIINKMCNIASEYGYAESYSAGSQAYLAEHCEMIIKDKALQVMADV